ncbi:hypothetical protein GCM10022236_38830 [Microlunatus ginsengisoli]|uniref:Uncharacterized protein n=2 Tax=Microlunatus ginsengisoli TaxID=363863 RepID=A0ABP7AHZ8_9ACTN
MGTDFPLLESDIADSVTLSRVTPIRSSRDKPLLIGWVTTPPALGSGGHTTMFRMINALESAGHSCVLFLYDRYFGDMEEHEAIIRRGWPTIRARVRDARKGIDEVDACVATSWQTAHVMAKRSSDRLPRFYFIQDFEPFFYARGPEYALAEDTYRFGFHCIALGHMVAEQLGSIGVSCDTVEFGCDTTVYSEIGSSMEKRAGVVFYTRPGVERRGYHLGVLALREFHRCHPDQEIHVYGSPPGDLGFPATRHARLTPPQLNHLYNRTIAGLALSFTNISLVAEEMLAAGTIPVINDSADARSDLPNPNAVWARPTPQGIAEALGAVVSDPSLEGRARVAASSVRPDNWKRTGDDVVRIIEHGTFE